MRRRGSNYLRNRYYDPGLGRFTQEDPIGFGGGGNLYGYSAGNPTNGRDPGGMEKEYLEYATPLPAEDWMWWVEGRSLRYFLAFGARDFLRLEAAAQALWRAGVPEEVAAAVWAEMRNAPRAELWQAVALVIRNRVEVSGLTAADVIFQRNAFSFTLEAESGPNWQAFMQAILAQVSRRDADRYIAMVQSVVEAWSGGVDFTRGALLYYSPRSMGGQEPNWNFSRLRLTWGWGSWGKFYACAQGSSCWARPRPWLGI